MEMKKIEARTILNIDTISKGNNKPWDKLIDYMDTMDEKSTVEFVFNGIEVNQPWATTRFITFLSDPRVHIRFVNAGDDMIPTIESMCTLSNISGGRVVNEKIQMKKVVSPEEKKIANMAESLQSYFKPAEDGNGVVLHIYDRFTQIGMPMTVEYIKAAVRMYHERTGETNICVYTQRIGVPVNILELMSAMIDEMMVDGINCFMKIDDPETERNFKISRTVANNRERSMDEKLNILKARMSMDKPCLLLKYRETRGLDNFGRQGHGEIVSSRIALFKGIGVKDGEPTVRLKVFSGHHFYLRDHWSLEYDGEELTKLDCNDYAIPLSQIGLYSDFLGAKFHIITPVQLRPNDSITMFSYNEQGNVVSKKYTIPERIKAVFDDFGEPYDKAILDKYIEDTKEFLASLKG